MRLLEFVRASEGRFLDFDGAYGAQCVDLVQYYLRDCHAQAPWAGPTAASMSSPRPGWRWVANSPLNYPSAGDVVVWGAWPAEGIGQAGHIAIALAADSAVLVTLDQNWPDGAPVAVRVHDYGGVAGWHTPA